MEPHGKPYRFKSIPRPGKLVWLEPVKLTMRLHLRIIMDYSHGLRGHVRSKTYSVVDDIRNQFIIGAEKIVIFVIRKLILNFSVGFSIFKTNMVFTPTKILRSNSQDPRPVLIFVFIKMIASHVNETGPFENFSYN